MKNAQATVEFIIFCSIGFIIMLSFLAVIDSRINTIRKEREISLADEMAQVIKGEITTAAGMQDGYSRIFTLPATLDGNSYSAVIQGTSIKVSTGSTTSEMEIPPLKNGSSILQINTIKKEGIVCINIECP